MRAVLLLLAFVTVALPAESRRRAAGRGPALVTIQDDFRNGQLGWVADFADYSPASAPTMELDAGMRPLPPELGTPGTGFFLTGHNRSDDLFMFLAKKLTQADGILPRQAYELTFRIVLASNAGSHCIGAGGAPGESVYLKAGATGTEPQVSLDDSNHYQVNFDKANQSQSGMEVSVAGDIANGTSDCSGDAPFVSIERTHRHAQPVTSSPFGEIWLIVGTDSGFEGKTTLYYQEVEAALTPR
ncbi:MAG TPA: hypothetical protein VNA04_13010 [Thermoanaerobaculia bacterium]|nr:hypothetical protein [Thermoanaerobaculia bacterium]